MRAKLLNLSSDISNLLTTMGVDKAALKILDSKSSMRHILIQDLHVGAANILKQDALSVGADLAVPRGTVIAQTSKVDALLLATPRQLQRVAKKALSQPFGLKDLASMLQATLQIDRPNQRKIMGIINANDDSFYASSRFSGHGAIEMIEKMIDDGADMVDIGAVSSRPNALDVSEEDEMLRVKAIIDTIYEQKLYESVQMSIDSYTPSVLQYALDRGFSIVNDIRGLEDEMVCKLCAEYNATAIIMHMQGRPSTMQIDPQYDDILIDISDFFTKRIDRARGFGVEDIVLDVGIGFGKTLEHNLSLIANLEHFLLLGLPLLVGASRKSLISELDQNRSKDRLAGTIALHLEAVRNGASIVRVHDVAEHKQALDVAEAVATLF